MFLYIAAAWLALVVTCVYGAVSTIVTTSGILKGVAITNNTNAYLGIPFAVPPVGLLRFAAPVPLITPLWPRNVTSFSPACVQLGLTFSNPVGESEDCLYLNVWTSPGTTSSSQKKPVFVWIHGGGFNSGSASLPLYDLKKWAVAHPEIVFVSINYRLNLFGYPDTPAITPPNTNAGLRDQRLAIEWVNKNIAAFGGDPNRVTVGGQSAGSASVSGYLYAHPNDALISGAILMSGQSLIPGTFTPGAAIPGLPTGTNPFPALASAVGCPLQGDNYSAQLLCVKLKSTTQLTTAIAQQNITGFGLVVDNQTVYTRTEYNKRGLAGNFAKVPVLTGTTNDEGDLFVLNRATNTINETLSLGITLAGFRCPDSVQSKYFIAAGVPTYRYRYLARFPTISPPPLRAYHGADLLILFGTSQGRAPTVPPPTALEEQATVYLQNAFSAFIRDPANGLLTMVGWPRYTGTTGKTLIDIFPTSTPQEPIQTENPAAFDALCALFG